MVNRGVRQNTNRKEQLYKLVKMKKKRLVLFIGLYDAFDSQA